MSLIDGVEFTRLAREGNLTTELVEMFYLLSDQLYSRHPVSRFVDKDDARQEAAIRCCSIVATFNERVRGSAYNYFRSVVYHLFCDMVKSSQRDPISLAGGREPTDASQDYRPFHRGTWRP
jgi:DNA-directed RNA polymerase specialized sigma24 family protein